MSPHRRERLHASLLTPLVLMCLWALWTVPAVGQNMRRFPGGSTGTREQTVKLEGWVRTDSGLTLPPGVIVRLETRAGVIAGEQPTNRDGHFEFPGLPKITLTLKVNVDGFQPYQQTIDISQSAGNLMLTTINLSPLGKMKETLTSLPSFTDDQAPKQARKEYARAVHALQEQNPKEALAHFKKAVDEYPCYARAQTDLATVLSDQRQVSLAEAALKKALECDPGFLDAYSELGQLFYVENRFAESEAVLQEGLRRSPGAWQFYYQLGSAHYGLGQYQKAEEEYLKAESFNSAVPPDIHVKLANAYLKTSTFDKAYAEMQAYLHAEPNGRFAPKVKYYIQKMESDGIVGAAQPAQSEPHPPKS
jgi:tetratricopeptide (TPR) repeat protein